MFKVGLTGGIGSGKSTVTKRFQSLGIHIVDADQVAREVVATGSEGLQAIVQEFGHHIVDEQGGLDRQQMRNLIAEDSSARARLEAITHPLIRKCLLAEMAKPWQSAYIMVDIPLLVEKNYQTLFDAVVVVDCTPEQQLQRSLQRDNSDESVIKGIMRAQASRAERLRHASHVLDNSTSLESLYDQIEQLHQTFLHLASPA